MAATGDGVPFTAISVDGGPPKVSPGDSARTTVIAAGVHSIAYYARDAAGNVDDGADSNGQPNMAPATVPLRIDREPPTVVFAGSANPEEPELIEARVADDRSGPDPHRGQIAVRPAGSGDPYTALPTLAAGETLLARWHSDEFPVGRYEFRATAYDAAGNWATSTSRANGAAMVLPNPLKARAILLAGLGGGFGLRQAGRTLRYGRRTTFGGRLEATSDTSLAGRPVRVVERFDPGAEVPRRTTEVATAGDGRFSVTLPPGASREVFAVFEGTDTATGTASRPLRLGVRSGVSMRVSKPLAKVGGRPVVFRGTARRGTRRGPVRGSDGGAPVPGRRSAMDGVPNGADQPPRALPLRVPLQR